MISAVAKKGRLSRLERKRLRYTNLLETHQPHFNIDEAQVHARMGAYTSAETRITQSLQSLLFYPGTDLQESRIRTSVCQPSKPLWSLGYVGSDRMHYSVVPTCYFGSAVDKNRFLAMLERQAGVSLAS